MIYTVFSNTPIPLKAKDLALEGLSPKTCFRNKRHQKVSLAYTWIYLQNDDFLSHWIANWHSVLPYATIILSPVFARGPLGLKYYQ